MNTTRWQFILSLFGVGTLSAQQRYKMYHDPEWKRCEVDPGKMGATADINWGCEGHHDMKRARNRECPVCATMADPVKKQWIQDGTAPVPGTDLMRTFGHYAESEHLTRCARCNAAFFQDAGK